MKAVPLKIRPVVAPNCTKQVVGLVVDADEIFLKAYLRAAERMRKPGPVRRQVPREERVRVRRTVDDIYNCLGPTYFRRAYRMTYECFLLLHSKLHLGILDAEKLARGAVDEEFRPHNTGATMGATKQKGNCHPKNNINCYPYSQYKPPPTRNGKVSTKVRLACAIRYFAGGSPYDLMGKYGVSYTVVLNSVSYVVEAINQLKEFHINYPEAAEAQQRIAAGFQAASAVDFDNCAGAIDGILIWIQKPWNDDAAVAGVGPARFYCGRKHKYGLNCQAVSDRRGRILDISIKYGGSSSDCLAFEASDLYARLEKGLLQPGLVIFGDNAYLNSPYMATPFPGVSAGSKDDYNFYHSQVSHESGLAAIS
jgi:DDE superfamily endonuclease